MLYQKTSKAWKWWIAQQCPSSYTWVPKTQKKWVPRTQKKWVPKTTTKADGTKMYNSSYYIVGPSWMHQAYDGQCITACAILLTNSCRKVQSQSFHIGQFCDADLEVAFRKSTCFVRDLQGNDLLTGNHGTDLYTISLQDTELHQLQYVLLLKQSPTSSMVMASMSKANEAHQVKRLFQFKKVGLNLLHMELINVSNAGLTSINGKKYILSKGYRVYNKRTRLIVESIHLRFDEFKEMSETSVANDTSGLVPQRQKASDYDNPDPEEPEPKSSTKNVLLLQQIQQFQSQQELDLSFWSFVNDEFFNDVLSRVNKASSPPQ
ncbi:hypothetical protein Tco_0605646 [Tanacetum coccineum]